MVSDEQARKVAELLATYNRVTEEWQRVNEEAEAEGSAPTVKDCERYSDALEQIAHGFAWVLGQGQEAADLDRLRDAEAD